MFYVWENQFKQENGVGYLIVVKFIFVFFKFLISLILEIFNKSSVFFEYRIKFMYQGII